jgi:hypothetical protein
VYLPLRQATSSSLEVAVVVVMMPLETEVAVVAVQVVIEQELNHLIQRFLTR